MKLPSFVLVILQFACIAYFVIAVNFKFFNLFSSLILVCAVFLGIAAILYMSWNNFSVMPEPKSNSKLITRGPYTIIRHPMYTAVLLFCASFLFSNLTYLNFSVFCILAIVLVIKINKEEKYLLHTFNHYSAYSEKTNKIIPFIW